MKARVRQIGGVSVIDLSGKITIGNGDITLRQSVRELLDRGYRQILLNLQKVSYMDSAGIGELAACYRRVQEKQGTIKLLNSEGKVNDLFQMMQVQELMDSFQDEEQAILSFASLQRTA